MNKNSKGQSLIEVTVASTALIFGMVSIISGLILAVRNSAVSNNQSLATQQAQETIEVFRQYQRTLGWESFYGVINADGSSVTYCLNDLPTDTTGFQSMPVGACPTTATNTDFVRQASISVVSATQIDVTVTVQWRDGNTVREASAKNIFRAYR